MKSFVFGLLLALNLATTLPSDARAAVELAPPGAPAFPLVAAHRAAVLVVPADSASVVHVAAADLAADVERVTGLRPAVVATPPASGPRITVALSPGLAGRWEAFQLSATPDTLTVAGSDARGLAYGLYELSRRIGVSPWYWWADVPVTRRDSLSLSLGAEPIDQPAVKYRGIFLNDEDWGLQPWAAKTFEPETRDIGPKTYAKIFELLLRLRANTLWPAMHECTRPFHLVPGNNAVADRYAIILGSSHAEPMLRNNVGEWTAPKDHYNYVTHRDDVLAYWDQRVRERTSGESLFTLGMRGIHDSPIVGPKNQAERIATLEKIIADQRGLLARHLGGGYATRVPQLFCPYKEVLEDYDAGLSVPDDVTLLWPDDNFGYIRRFATPAERARSGGLGVYYHASYLGAPLSWLWIDSLPPALIWSEMTRAYEQGARHFWIVNVGDIKNTERSTEFFLDLAWHADRTSPAAPSEWMRASAARDFGPAHAEAIASLLARHHLLAAARKPEHLQWNLPLTPYQPTTLTFGEMRARLAAYATLAEDCDKIAASLPADAQDAFFQLVAYPVKAAAAANAQYFLAELARQLKAQSDEPAANATFDASALAGREVEKLTDHYNEFVAGAKWRHIVAINGVSPRVWARYQPVSVLPPLNSPAQDAVRPLPPEPPPEPLTIPADARSGDFVEHWGVVSIEAGHFTSREDVSGGGWRVIPGLGRTGSAVTVLPSTLTGAPSLAYRFHTTTASAAATVRIRLLPTHPVVPGNGLRLALAIDDGLLLPVAVTKGFDPKSAEWTERVLANATDAVLPLPSPLAAGAHTLRIVAVDTGVVVDKIVIDLGGLTASYDGPPETRAP